MNEEALKKTKKELLLNSKLGKERKRLSEEYRDGIIRITNEILGEEGKKFLEKYKDITSFYDELLIPGQITVHIIKDNSNSVYYSRWFDSFESPGIFNIISGLNNVYSYNKNDFSVDIIPKEEDQEWIKNIRNQLESNAEEYERLRYEIDSIFKNITEKELKIFPEAYSLYTKFRNEIKDEKQPTA